MKTVIVLMLMALPVMAAETNVFYEVLETPGRKYTNATVKAFTDTHLTVYHDNGIAKVAKGDLNEWVRMRFEGGDSTQTADTNKLATQQAIAQYKAAAAKAAAWRGEPKEVEILQLIGSMGRDKCLASVDGEGTKEILITLPARLKQAYAEVARLEKQIASFSTQVKRETEAAENANATAPTYASGDSAYVNAAMAQRDRANLMILNAKRQAAKLEEMQTSVSAYREAIKASSKFMASKTAQKYAGLEVLEYVGPVQKKSLK